MAKRQHLIHLHSTTKEGTLTGLTSANLQLGELAMYNSAVASGVTLYALNSTKDGLAQFKTDDYYKNEFKKFAASGHTSVSATTSTIGHVKLVGGDLSGNTGSTVNGEAAASQHTHSQYSLTSHNHDSKYAPISHSHGTIKLTGDATGEANFTNTGASIAVTVGNDSHTHKTSTISDRVSGGTGITATATGATQANAVYEYAAPKEHTHPYVPDTQNLTVKLTGDVTGEAVSAVTGGTISISTTVGNDSHTHKSSGITDSISAASAITSSATGLVQGKAVHAYAAPKEHSHPYLPVGQSLTVKLEGDVTGEATANLSAGTLTLTNTAVGNDSHTHKSSGITDSISDYTKITSSATALVQGKAVYNYVDSKFAANDAMLYKGAITAVSGIPSTFQAGWTYKVASAGTYYGQALEVGDMIIAVKDATNVTITTSNFAEYWNAIQTNTDGHVSGPASAVSGNVAIFDGTTGKLIKDSGKTLGKSVPSNAVFTDSATTQAGHYTPGTGTTVKAMASQDGVSGGKVTIPSLQFDDKGHYVATTASTVINLPEDTHHTAKNIVGASSSAKKDATATNGNVWLNLIENDTVRSHHKISGAGATTVTASTSGEITITSTDSATTLDGHYAPSGTGTVISGSSGNLAWSGNFIIPTVEYDSKGHIIKSGSTTVNMPANPNTDYQVKSSTGTSKYYLVGSNSSATTTGETYKHASVYAEKGVLYSESTKVVNTTALTETLKNYYTTGQTDTLLAGKLSSVSIKGKFGVDTGGISTETYTATPTATTFDLTSISIDCGEY